MPFETLTRNNDFVRAYKRGKCLGHAHIVLYAFPKKRGPVRVGITASKKIGGAVVRNRARRVVRHALAQTGLPQTGHYDLVFVARSQTPALKSYQLAATIQKLLARLEADPPVASKASGGGRSGAGANRKQTP